MAVDTKSNKTKQTKTSSVDPNDFADEGTPAGKIPGENVQNSGKPGSGGMTTGEAQEAYNRATEKHMDSETKPSSDESKKEYEEKEHRLSQVGSLEDNEKSIHGVVVGKDEKE